MGGWLSLFHTLQGSKCHFTAVLSVFKGRIGPLGGVIEQVPTPQEVVWKVTRPKSAHCLPHKTSRTLIVPYATFTGLLPV